MNDLHEYSRLQKQIESALWQGVAIGVVGGSIIAGLVVVLLS
jgi:uncharacterized protein (DUF2062 family)